MNTTMPRAIEQILDDIAREALASGDQRILDLVEETNDLLEQTTRSVTALRDLASRIEGGQRDALAERINHRLSVVSQSWLDDADRLGWILSEDANRRETET